MSPRVSIPTWEPNSVCQTVIGKPSPVSPDLEEFRGIPYGNVTARWEQAQVRTRLPDDVFDATKNGPKCPQPPWFNNSRAYQAYLPFPDDPESEFDCLNLFVVRPSAAALERRHLPTEGLPVLVWIHGGGLAFGAATDPIWDPSRLVLRSLEQGTPIVAVYINYRLNVFGFAASADLLEAQDPTGTGGLNFGLRDQKVALTWISRHIAAFGGDPAKVTVGGQSAGAVSTHTHLAEAAAVRLPARPLLRRAILQSGAMGTLGPFPLSSFEEPWKNLCKAHGLSLERTSAHDRVSALRAIPAPELLAMAAQMHVEGFPIVADDVTLQVPTTQTSVSNQNSVVDLGPVDLHHPRRAPPQGYNKDHKGLDVMLGVTDLEACIFLQNIPPWDHIQSVFAATYTDPELRDEILQAYGLTATATAEALRQGIFTFLSDAIFEVPVHLTRTVLHTQPGIDHVQAYHVRTGNPFPGPFASVAHHCVEMIFLFEAFHAALVDADAGILRPYAEPGEECPKVQATPSDKRSNLSLCHEMQDTWLRFITADNLTPEVDPSSIIVYGQDRSRTVESLANGPAWQQRQRRWELLARDTAAMERARIDIRRPVQKG